MDQLKDQMVRNLGDATQVKEAKAKEKRGRDLQLSDLKFALSTKPGRRLVWRMLCKCGIYEQSAADSGSWTYFNEGRRSVGLFLIAEIMEVEPESYVLMMKESKENY